MTDDEAKGKAKELAEAIPVIREFFSMSNEDRVLVGKNLLDMQIGTDSTAVIRNVAGMPAALVESVTDPLLGVAAEAIIKLLSGPASAPTG